MNWEDHASCRREDPRIFFPHEAPDKYEQSYIYPEDALKICEQCPVIQECKERCGELEKIHGYQSGVWAGLTEEDRRRGGRGRKVHQPRPFCARGHFMGAGNVKIVGGSRRCAICYRAKERRCNRQRGQLTLGLA
jgi:WhiB family redox-sensing transcriptional regulator